MESAKHNTVSQLKSRNASWVGRHRELDSVIPFKVIDCRTGLPQSVCQLWTLLQSLSPIWLSANLVHLPYFFCLFSVLQAHYTSKLVHHCSSWECRHTIRQGNIQGNCIQLLALASVTVLVQCIYLVQVLLSCTSYKEETYVLCQTIAYDANEAQHFYDC